MAVPSDYAEARDPRTSPQRLHELAQVHPELQPLILLNPGCPQELGTWIQRTNPTARRVLEERREKASREEEWVQGGEGDGATATLAAADLPTGASAASDVPPAGPAASRASIPEGSSVAPLPTAAHSAPAAHAPARPSADEPLPPELFARESAPEQERRGSRTALWALVGCLVLLVPLAAGGFVLARSMSGGGERSEAPAAQTSEEAASSSQEGEGPASGSGTGDGESSPLVSPAPEGATELSAVVSPSGNISCSLDGVSVGCSLSERSYSSEDCPASGPFSISVGEDEPGLACGSSFGGEDAATLAYGSSAVDGDVACTSESAGMTCWNMRTGHGFRVSRSEYTTF